MSALQALSIRGGGPRLGWRIAIVWLAGAAVTLAGALTLVALTTALPYAGGSFSLPLASEDLKVTAENSHHSPP